MKHPPVKPALQAIATNVQSEYRDYVQACKNNSLDSFTNSAFTGIDLDYLRECYADRLEVNNLKEDIYNNQENHIAFECQYCTIGSSEESFDHYLPKEDFPEFSVLSNNLIPSCSKCNSLKKTRWKDTGLTRNIINYYYDVLPAQQYLFCTIIYRRGTPIIDYSLNNPGGINPNLFRIITRHYERLNLIERFKKNTNNEVTNIINSLTPLVTSHSLAQASNYLLNDVIVMKSSFGNNYWKAILKEKLATTPQFLSRIGFV
jgi:5-methylcytosine-specific restriction endonuclease McrA